MAHLTDQEIVSIKEIGEYPIGPTGKGYGVNISVTMRKSGQLVYRWIQYVYIKNPKTGKTIRRRKISLKATFPETRGAAARDLGKANQALANEGVDPADVQESDLDEPNQKPPPSFREMAEGVFDRESKRVAKGNLTEERLRIFRLCLNNYLLPAIGDKRMDRITRDDIFCLMEPYFDSKFPTFVNIWGYARKTFLIARKRWPDLLNPVDEAVREWLGPSNHQEKHHDYVPYHLVWQAIDRIKEVTHPRAVAGNLCLLMVILTGCRGKEARLMEWDQLRSKVITSPEQWNESKDLWDPIDWDNFDEKDTTKAVVWFIPGENTKTSLPRRVFMSSWCLDILREAWALHERRGSHFVFPSPHPPFGTLNKTCLARKCRTLELLGTPHGFRTALRIWWGEVGGESDAGELQLGHRLGPIKRAYLRSDLLAERAEMMEAWSQYLRGELPPDWEWISPKAAAKLKAAEEERDELKEEVRQLRETVETLTELVANIETADKRAAQEAEARAMEAEKRLAEIEENPLVQLQSSMPLFSD